MSKRQPIELSADMGEGTAGEDALWPLIDAASVACGGHVGDAESMTAAIRRAKANNVLLGAHPSYPDREHFGRRSLKLDPDFLVQSLTNQVGTLRDIATREGVVLRRVKPHGALYNDAHTNRELADLVVEAMLAVDRKLALVAPAASQMASAAHDQGLQVIREAFADRRYEPTGALVSRKDPDALLSVEEAAAQAELLAKRGAVQPRTGPLLPLAFDTICVHADMEHAVERLRAIRARL
ncbi:MAG: lactam utilization protein LamB [Acidobacteria bacterium]|nr:lactam utilization protein LamB [Acidobacteriota bacterium]